MSGRAPIAASESEWKPKEADEPVLAPVYAALMSKRVGGCGCRRVTHRCTTGPLLTNIYLAD